MRTRADMRSYVLPLFFVSSFAVACAAESSSPAAAGGAASGSSPETADALATEREVGTCGTPMKPLTVGLQDDESPPTSFEPKVTAKGTADSIVFIVANGGVDCDGGDIQAKQSADGFIDVALRFRRIDGKPSATLCRCSPDVKGTIKDLAPGHYELRVVREKLAEGTDTVVEEPITRTSLGVDVGG